MPFMKRLPLSSFISAVLSGVAAVAVAADKPNLVIVIADDLGVLDCQPYGATDVRTPHMQQLACQHATHINRAATGDGLSYFRSWEDAAKTNDQAARIVRRYKERPAEELYDLVADPHEQHNLAAEAQHAQRLAEMRAKLTAWMKLQNDQQTVFNTPLLLGQEAAPIGPAAGAKKKSQNAK